MHSWQQSLKNRVKSLEDENLKLNGQIALLVRENNLLNKLVSGPPTIMIACEKVVDSAARVTESVNNILEKSIVQKWGDVK